MVHLDGEHLAVGVGGGAREQHPPGVEPCSTRAARTSPTPLILYTPEMEAHVASGTLGLVDHVEDVEERVDVELVTLEAVVDHVVPFHHPMFSVFLMVVTLQPEMGRTGTHFSTKSFFQPTLMSMFFISLAISS